jgi:hypothetical protein
MLRHPVGTDGVPAGPHLQSSEYTKETKAFEQERKFLDLETGMYDTINENIRWKFVPRPKRKLDLTMPRSPCPRSQSVENEEPLS